MFNYEEAKKAMEKLIYETERGIIKWHSWGSTDSLEKPEPTPKLDKNGEPVWFGSVTFPNWAVYYTKLVGTHVTVEDHLGDQRFRVYWGPPIGRGDNTMDIEKELPLMDELLSSIRNSDPESLPKWRFQWIDENKGPECWWMNQEHIWHTVKDTLALYTKGEIPHFAGNETDEKGIAEQKKLSDDETYGRVPLIRERYIINVWERLEPDYEITKYQVMHNTYNWGMSEIASRKTLEECSKVIEQHYSYYHSPYDRSKAKEWEIKENNDD
jgi:hypothetical protein